MKNQQIPIKQRELQIIGKPSIKNMPKTAKDSFVRELLQIILTEYEKKK